MTKLLEKAFGEASLPPEIDQNAFAKWLLEGLHSEAKWHRAFSKSEDAPDKLADEAIEEKRRSATTPLDPGRL